MTPHYQLKLADKAQLISTLEGIFHTLGAPLPEGGFQEKGDHTAEFIETIDVDGDQFDVTKRLVINYHPSNPIKVTELQRDAEGNLIGWELTAKTTTPEGEVTEFELYPGYHVELFSNMELPIEPALIVNPEVKQYKKA